MKALTYLMLFVSMAAFAEEATYAAARAAMVEELRLYAQILDDPDEARISDAVMTSMGTVKRHELVPQQESRFAYENRPLPIGWSIVRRGLAPPPENKNGPDGPVLFFSPSVVEEGNPVRAGQRRSRIRRREAPIPPSPPLGTQIEYELTVRLAEDLRPPR